MAEIAEAVLDLGAGPEVSVAASKTYTGELTALAMLAAHWSGEARLLDDLRKLPDWVAQVLETETSTAACAQAFASASAMVCVGRGYNHATSYEIALKVKELAYIAAHAYSAADFRHGPIAMLEPGFPVLATAPQGEALADMAALIEELAPTGARLAVLSNDPAVLNTTDLKVRLPSGVAEWLSPVVCTIPGQFLALHLALLRGFDPDRPRGLHKVTLTR